MKIALVHDSLVQYGGAERVLQAVHDLYPDAPVYTLAIDPKMAGYFEDWTIVSSPLQYVYNMFPRLQWLLPLIPPALRFFDFSQYDVVLSFSSAFAKGVRVPKGTLHINYCHTPDPFFMDRPQLPAAGTANLAAPVQPAAAPVPVMAAALGFQGCPAG